MSKTLRLAAAISLATILGLMIPARAQQEPTKRAPVQGQNHPPGPDRPFEGAPAFVSEVEFMDDGLGAGAPPAVLGAPVPAVVGTATSSRCGSATRRRTSATATGRMRRPALRAMSIAIFWA
jgi:hypothetical protein